MTLLEERPSADRIRVALVDDQQLVRSGFGMLINSQPDLDVVVEAGNGLEALQALGAVAADVVLMDVRMPGMDGIEATRRLMESALAAPAGSARADLRVVVLTTFDLDEYALAAIQAGASGFLLKDAPPEELLEAIRTVHRGDAVIAPSTTRRLLDHVAPLLRTQGNERPEHHAAVQRLTTREREVFHLLIEGSTTKEVARALQISAKTAENHRAHVLEKLGAHNTADLVRYAVRKGLLGRGGVA